VRLRSAFIACSLLALAGCGSSSSYSDTVRPAVLDMARTLDNYNKAAPSDAQATARACDAAHNSLVADSSLIDTSPPDASRQLGNALAQAFKLALAGFADCARGEYQPMARGDAELSRANTWIVQARKLDH
jgi:hypothetical protein